jgi:AcrR family transcriptional regulator
MALQKGARVHTGRARNETARRAILEAAAGLLATSELADISIARIAEIAGVGRQTIYRWWPSKGAVLADAMVEQADDAVDVRPTGDIRADLLRFVAQTFAAARHPAATRALRSLLGESLRDAPAAELLQAFTTRRREQLRSLVEASMQAPNPEHDIELVADQIFGVLWYRLAISQEPLDDGSAARLADAVLRQLRAQE